MLAAIRNHLKDICLSHLTGPLDLIAEQNFTNQLSKLSEQQKNFWFKGHKVSKLADLENVPAVTNEEIIATQLLDFPHGILEPGEILLMSSGSTGSPRVQYYQSWDNWINYQIGAARGLLAHEIGPADTLMTTDVGNMQAGYRNIEEAASLICGTKIIKSGQTTWHQKLDLINDHKVTVLVASTTKLRRLAGSIQEKNKVSSLRLIIQVGEAFSTEDAHYVSEAFGVEKIVNFYGCAEMGQISYTCPFEHTHVHDDLMHVVQGESGSLMTKLTGLAIFNIANHDIIQYTYKGKCRCGSYLPTVDVFKSRDHAQILFKKA